MGEEKRRLWASTHKSWETWSRPTVRTKRIVREAYDLTPKINAGELRIEHKYAVIHTHLAGTAHEWIDLDFFVEIEDAEHFAESMRWLGHSDAMVHKL